MQTEMEVDVVGLEDGVIPTTDNTNEEISLSKQLITACKNHIFRIQFLVSFPNNDYKIVTIDNDTCIITKKDTNTKTMLHSIVDRFINDPLILL